MKLTLATLLSLSLLAGCQSREPREAPPQRAETSDFVRKPVAALVYTPPVSLYGEQPELPRDERGASAYLGFQEPQFDNLIVVTDDRLGDGFYVPNRYERRAIAVQSATRVR
jgi:hypothetical protein